MAKKKTTDNQIDEVDVKILSSLADNANQAYTLIGKEHIISHGTVHIRMKKLKKMGVVSGAHLIVNPKKLGYDICAFLGICLEKNSMYTDVAKELASVKELIELHHSIGSYDAFAKIICKNIGHFHRVLTEKIQNIPGIKRTKTFISLEESINRSIDFQKTTPTKK